MQNPGTEALNRAHLLENITPKCTYAHTHTIKPLTPTERASLKLYAPFSDVMIINSTCLSPCLKPVTSGLSSLGSLSMYVINVVTEIAQCQSAQNCHEMDMSHTVAAYYLP